MSRELNFSLANILSDLAPAKRKDRKSGDEQAQTSAVTNPTPFGKMVSDAPRDVSARRPTNSPPARDKKLQPGQLSREQRAMAQAKSSREAEKIANESFTLAEAQDERPVPAAPPEQRDSRTLDDKKPTIAAAEKVAPDARPEAATKPEAREAEGGKDTADAASESTEVVTEQASAETPGQDMGAPVAAPEEGGEILATNQPTPGAALAPALPVTPGEVATEAVEGEAVAAVIATAADTKAKGAPAAKSGNATGVEAEEEALVAGDGEASEMHQRSPVAEKAAELRAARPEEGKQGIGEEISAFAKAQKGQEGEATKAKGSAAPSLHPARVAPFAEILEGFTHVSAVHRPIDILAGLDRNVAASATHNRLNEVQRPTPLQMLPIEIGMQAVRGVSNFQIRLDPAELGRVDVHLQINDKGEVNASLVVDRVETLQMLKRDASTLQYAFEQAGLRQSADGLSFSLRGEGQNGQQQENSKGGHHTDAVDEANLQTQIGEIVMRRALIPNSSVDLMV